LSVFCCSRPPRKSKRGELRKSRKKTKTLLIACRLLTTDGVLSAVGNVGQRLETNGKIIANEA